MRHLTIVYEIPDTMTDVSELTGNKLARTMRWGHETNLKTEGAEPKSTQTEWTVNPNTLLFENLRPLQAQDLESLAYEGQIFGNTYYDHTAVVAFFNAAQIKKLDQKLLFYSTVFLQRAALSASLFFSKEIYG